MSKKFLQALSLVSTVQFTIVPGLALLLFPLPSLAGTCFCSSDSGDERQLQSPKWAYGCSQACAERGLLFLRFEE